MWSRAGIVRGYSSETFAHAVAESIALAVKPVFVYQLGDHDPSGVDAWNSFVGKVRTFASEADVTFERLAVTESRWTPSRRPCCDRSSRT